MSHLKRLSAPPFWKVARKETRWVVAPTPGPHAKLQSIPLSIILKHLLNIANTTTEAKKIIRMGEIIVDGKRKKDYAYPIGMFDTISIPKIKKNYRIVPGPKGLLLSELDGNEANIKICKINNKSTIGKNKTQLNLHDGKNIIVENGDYNTGDSLLLELPSLKILEHLKLEKGTWD